MKTIQIGNSILINDDCLKAMDFLIEKGIKVDAIITDPPYELTPHGAGRSSLTKRATKVRDGISFIADGFNYKDCFDRFLALCKTPNILIFCSNKQISTIMSYFEQKKLSVTLMCWRKTNPIPLCNGKYINDLEYIIYIRGKNAPWNNKASIDIKYRCKSYPTPSAKNRKHPTEKPLDLIQELVHLHTLENQIVLDSFMGSATTGIACQNLNRKFIGIEWNPEKDKEGNLVNPEKYFNIGVERMRENLEKINEN